MPLYGKLADLVGRKPMMLLGIGLFLLGSVLCGFAWSMAVADRRSGPCRASAPAPCMPMAHDDRRRHLLGRRAGEGAGLRRQRLGRRRRSSGPPSAASSPTTSRWRWIFFVNIPHRRSPRCSCCSAASTRRSSARTHRIDYAGAVLLAVGCIAADPRPARGRRRRGRGTRRRASPSSPSARLLLVAFVFVERAGGRADPAAVGLPPPACSSAPTLTPLGVGVILIGLTSYVPLYAQGVLGTAPLVAGFALAALTLGWPHRRRPVGPALPAHRVPRHRADRHASSSSWPASCCSPSAPTARCWRSRSPAS